MSPADDEPSDLFAAGIEEYRAERFDEAARFLLTAADTSPNDRRAPEALLMAANAFIRAGRPETASFIHRRIVDLGPERSDDPDHQELLDFVFVTASFLLGLRAAESSDHAVALRHFQVIADGRIFDSSNTGRVFLVRCDARLNAAQLLERMRRVPEAIRYYTDLTHSMCAGTERHFAEERLEHLAP